MEKESMKKSHMIVEEVVIVSTIETIQKVTMVKEKIMAL